MELLYDIVPLDWFDVREVAGLWRDSSMFKGQKLPRCFERLDSGLTSDG